MRGGGVGASLLYRTIDGKDLDGSRGNAAIKYRNIKRMHLCFLPGGVFSFFTLPASA